MDNADFLYTPTTLPKRFNILYRFTFKDMIKTFIDEIISYKTNTNTLTKEGIPLYGKTISEMKYMPSTYP